LKHYSQQKELWTHRCISVPATLQERTEHHKLLTVLTGPKETTSKLLHNITQQFEKEAARIGPDPWGEHLCFGC
jgi:hypothetical protein